MSRITASLAILLFSVTALSAPSSGTTYSISPKSFPDLCVAPSSDSEGSKLIVTSCDNASSDIAWVYDNLALKNSGTEMCVDITDGGNWSGNLAQEWTCYGWNFNQMFTINGDMITWKGKNQCLDLKDGKGTDGTAVQIWSCGSSNPNQQWIFNEVEEVDGCAASTTTSTAVEGGATKSTGTASVAIPTTTGQTGSDGDDLDDGDDSGDESVSSLPATTSSTMIVSASTSFTSTALSSNSTQSVGGELWAGANSSSSVSSGYTSSSSTFTTFTGNHSRTYTKSSSSSSMTVTSSTTASVLATLSTASITTTGAAATATASSTATNASTTSTTSSGYLQVSGTSVVDSNGQTVVLRGTNLGGWLVMEDWMCGITDESGSADRFSQTTLENRFGVDQTHALLNIWYDNWLVSSDWDNLAALGFNVVRLPFGFRNLQWANGSWITDASGNIDMSRLDWAVAQAKARNIYVIPVFHIWDGQEAGYSDISTDTTKGQSQRDSAGEIWKKVAAHFLGESTIAAYDAINEPTGSANDNLQRDLYNAIRSVDANRIIVMESIGTNPSNYGWTNVMYSLHEYLMMGSDVSYNEQQWNNGAANDITQWLGYNIPVYIGEFMADDTTLSWMLGQINDNNLWWSGWTYKTVNMGRWGLFNTGSISVDVSSDSYDSIQNTWSNLGGLTEQAVASQYKSAVVTRKRSAVMGSPRVGETKRFTGVHKGRSRRTLLHGGSARF